MIASGRGIARDHYEIVVDRRSGIAVGERIGLGRHQFAAVGVTANLVRSGGDPAAFVKLRDSQRMQFDLAPARRELARGAGDGTTDIVNPVVADVEPGVPAATIATTARQWKHLAEMIQAEQETLLTRPLIACASRQIGLFTVVLMIVSTVIIALIVYTMTIDKRREIATLKLTGAPDRCIVALIV